jgi:hypothetical protein
MDRHVGLLGPGAAVIYNGEFVKPGPAPEGVRLFPLPVSELTHNSRNKLEQNTLAVAAGLSMMGIGFQPLAEVLTEQFKKKKVMPSSPKTLRWPVQPTTTPRATSSRSPSRYRLPITAMPC